MQSIKFILLGIAAILIGVIGSNLAIGGEPVFVFITFALPIVGIILCVIGAMIPCKHSSEERDNSKDMNQAKEDINSNNKDKN